MSRVGREKVVIIIRGIKIVRKFAFRASEAEMQRNICGVTERFNSFYLASNFEAEMEGFI